MTRDEARDRIAFRLGNRGSDVNLLDNIVAELKLAQNVLENGAELPWFLLSQRATLSPAPTTGVESFALPSNFLRLPDEGEGGIWVLNTLSGFYEKLSLRWSYEELANRFSSEVNDRPQYLANVGLYGYVRPIPNANYTYQAIYYAADAVLSTNIENSWLKYAPDVMISLALFTTSEALGDVDTMNKASKDLAVATDRMTRSNVAHREMGYERIIGDED